MEIRVKFVADDAQGLHWHAQLIGICLWCQAATPADAVQGVIEAMSDWRSEDGPNPYRDRLELIAGKW